MKSVPKSVVAIARDDDVQDMVSEVFSLLGGVLQMIRPGSTVVLKPNAGHRGGPESSVNTSPAVVAAVIREVRRAKPKEIIVAEAAAIGCDTMECLAMSGISQAAQEAGADRIIDIKRDKDLLAIPIRGARSAMTKVKLPRFLLEADFIIDIPVFKSHASMVFTNALKNLKGVVQDRVHAEMHQTVLTDALLDLWTVIKADLVIGDMVRPAEGFGPHTPVPFDFGCIVGGRDPVAVDATACRMVGLDIDAVPYLKAAAERGLGVWEEDRIEVVGKQIGEVYKKMWFPYLDGFHTWPEYDIYAENACSSCQALVAFSLEKMKALGEYEKNKEAVIVLGRKDSLPEGVEPKNLILCGTCLAKHRDKGIWIKGCPPGEPSVVWAIVDRQEQTGPPDNVRERMAAEDVPWMEYVRRKAAEHRGQG
ncbi:MAG TPA: DUF362 domain-containing protein [Spirochaetia bacterium]|nr:DUF362 domain-containing protein [Spirochaetia bacterium]